MKINRIWLIYILILAYGLLQRFWGIWHGSFAFTYDAGRDLLAVRDLVVNHKFSLIGPTSGQMGIFYGPWWYWILAIPFIISGGNPGFIIFSISLYGLLGALLVFWWGEKNKHRLFGLVFGGLLSISPYMVGATNQLWSPHLIPTTIVFAIILLFDFHKLSYLKTFILGMLLMLIFEFELIFGALFITAYLTSLVFFYRDKFILKKILIIFSGMFIIELPRILFDLRHNFLQLKTITTLLGNPANNTVYLDVRLKLIFDKFNFFSPFDNIYTAGLLFILILILFFKFKEKIDDNTLSFIKSLSLISLIFPLFVLIYRKEVWEYYLIGWPVILAGLISILINSVSTAKSKLRLTVIILIYLFILSGPLSVYESLKNPLFTGDAAVFRNQISAIDYVYKEAKGKDFNVTPYTPPQIEYTWRYLFSWYGKNKYGYTPKTQRSERLYMVIEPDPGYEGRITNWLKVREEDGRTIKEITLPSGIKIQSRIRPKENNAL